jgi:hypothetical protein
MGERPSLRNGLADVAVFNIQLGSGTPSEHISLLGLPPGQGYEYVYQENGWITKHIFRRYLRLLLYTQRAAIGTNVAIISDGHVSRTDVRTLRMLRRRGARLFVLPSHCTHVL